MEPIWQYLMRLGGVFENQQFKGTKSTEWYGTVVNLPKGPSYVDCSGETF